MLCKLAVVIAILVSCFMRIIINKKKPYFHSFTGCDTTSSFFRKGKKTAWEAWKSYPDVTTAFATIALNPFLDFNR